MQICQIAGYKNSGKTTLMNQLILYFSKTGVIVGSLKHHGHGGDPDLGKLKDNQAHMESGAIMSGVQGEMVSQFTLNMEMDLDEMVRVYSNFPIDLLLIEGYKHAEYPKIVLVRNREDLSLVDELPNVIAAGGWDSELLKNLDVPVFDMKKPGEYLPRLAVYIRRCSYG
ncbi:molybdopterin-guanine dinucleotide biosynthesis protein B [Virgibacillus siamensis]|uniref:molybdopterin-guanine dinucleotide biosynthesis protein B n=1 Tax=Virgibacillus siamensis TaxID=480071 RepID=UPI000985F7C2|nr:molybdopterin-guanine dinucleotide biosynthesis protein B [Virgibacillus siamensis]